MTPRWPDRADPGIPQAWDVFGPRFLGCQAAPAGVTLNLCRLSPYTVQDHLKAVLGVPSRREVQSRILFDHYAGRPTATGWFVGG
jgi:hypothetical protein